MLTEGPLQWSFQPIVDQALKAKSGRINTWALTYILNSCEKHDPLPPHTHAALF